MTRRRWKGLTALTIDRNNIIAHLKTTLAPLPFFHALWLEGADANGTADQYSDIDFWVDIEDDCETQAYEAVEGALAALAPLDYQYNMRHGHPKIRQRIYHLAGTSEYLMIDFCWQLHSREAYCFTENDSIEAAKVLFDKSGVIQFQPFNAADFTDENRQRLEKAIYRRSQQTRAEKYVRRGLYAEAYAYYNRYALEPLIDLLRLIYTPAHADYHLVHISQHIPKAELDRLEYFAQTGSLQDIAERLPKAAQWFDILLETIPGL